MSVQSTQGRNGCEGCDTVVAQGQRFCVTCEADLTAHIDALAAEERAQIEATEIAVDEQLRKNHGV